VNPPECTVGRHPDNAISLLLESVSRFHARLDFENGVWLLTDLNSSNGTFLNGQRLGPESRPVSDRDRITFGRADFIFSFFSYSELAAHGDTGFLKERESTSSVAIVPDDVAGSTILSSAINVESSPSPGQMLLAEKAADKATIQKINQRLLSLYKLSEVTRLSTTPEDMLNRVADLIFDVLPADRVVIMTAEPPDYALVPAVVRVKNGDGHHGGELLISRTIVQKCMNERVAVLSRDIRVDSRFSGSESLMASDIRSAMCIPLITKKAIIGILFIDTRESVQSFTEDDLAFTSSIANDISMSLENLRLAEENIKNERLAAVGQTIAGLAHNIKNILQLAKGGIELMDAAIARKSQMEIESFWPVVRRGIDRMQNLTQEMLDYSRQTKPVLHPANVNTVIEDMVRTFQADRVTPGVEIQVKLDPSVPDRPIDADGLVKAVMNLLSNSVDAFDGGAGMVVITSRMDPATNTIYIHVEDNGKGIPKDKLGRIFMPFFTTKGSKGTGLGLSMTKKYIEDMFGTISVESEEGRGTRFTIALPPVQPKAMAYDYDIETRDARTRGLDL
jgi:signal transduction histidine kinase/pSer/pThr/pTyr-binding forkhead associated (FHA) protein